MVWSLAWLGLECIKDLTEQVNDVWQNILNSKGRYIVAIRLLRYTMIKKKNLDFQPTLTLLNLTKNKINIIFAIFTIVGKNIL
jgi:hypothetical protein